MSADDAAELRRQKILRNKEKRLELLLGVKNSNGDTDSMQSDTRNCFSEMSHFPNVPGKTEAVILTKNHGDNLTRRSSVSAVSNTVTLTSPRITTTPTNETKTKNADDNKNILNICRFTGHSNLEILINFLIAFATTLLFYFQKSDIIYHNAILPFATFELAHLIFHFKCLPSTSSQFQMFITLLRLCGIQQTSLRNLMITLNFLFILIDNFVIYIFCFILSNMLVHLFSLLQASSWV